MISEIFHDFIRDKLDELFDRMMYTDRSDDNFLQAKESLLGFLNLSVGQFHETHGKPPRGIYISNELYIELKATQIMTGQMMIVLGNKHPVTIRRDMSGLTMLLTL